MTDIARTARVEYMAFEPDLEISILGHHGRSGEPDGLVVVPYLRAVRRESGGMSLILDQRFMLMLPDDMPEDDVENTIEFIANAIAIGSGYPSIYVTDHKMPFRG